ncbi:myelin protein zero-like protein 3 isoform X2 [Ambystoma mexicanum]|uniref:myelin protein zero-like protein 3 isoform X2 n=1 Tax=Ambystoma mexicanum TaxID=8296 RepID=UPI0037E9C68D
MGLGCLLLLLLVVSNVLSVYIKVDDEVYGVVGDQVKLRCTFQSDFPTSEKVTVDWTYKPQNGGPLETIFHYQREAYPTTSGIFKDRVVWKGNIPWKDASIVIEDLTLQDNGTFSCTVKNPPDVFSNLPHTVLMVTEKSIFFRLTEVSLLSILVFAPSTLVLILLFVRMGRKYSVLGQRRKSTKKSSIEVSREIPMTSTMSRSVESLSLVTWNSRW